MRRIHTDESRKKRRTRRPNATFDEERRERRREQGKQYAASAHNKAVRAAYRAKESTKASIRDWKRAWRKTPEYREASKKRYNENKAAVTASLAKFAAEHPERTKARAKRYYLKHRAKLLPRPFIPKTPQTAPLKRTQIYYLKNRELMIARAKRSLYKRLASDPSFRALQACRHRLYIEVRMGGSVKASTFFQLVGCDRHQLVAYLESRFLPGMSWDNYGLRGWHIDHIRPCSSFDFSDPEQQRKCFHFTNLQPLWAADNYRKGDTIPEHLQAA